MTISYCLFLLHCSACSLSCKISLPPNTKSFLDLVGGYSCVPADCSNSYVFSDMSIGTRTISYPAQNLFGFVLNGNIENISDFKFSLSSSFGKENNVPLSLKILEIISRFLFVIEEFFKICS